MIGWPGDRDHAQADRALPGRLSAPERLEGGEVAVVEQEAEQDEQREGPRRDRLIAERAEPEDEERREREDEERVASWTNVSIASARKRLPAPASGNSSAICSGVSMVSFSGGRTGTLLALALAAMD